MNVPSLALLLVSGVLVATGVYLLLERTLTRVFIGLGLLTHGVNVLILASGGAAGRPPLLGQEDAASMADALPQAMVLTSIVLSLGTTAFGLALAYRSWRLSGHDEVVDDVEDRIVFLRAERARPTDDDATRGTEDAGINYDSDPADPAASERDLEADGLPGPAGRGALDGGGAPSGGARGGGDSAGGGGAPGGTGQASGSGPASGTHLAQDRDPARGEGGGEVR